jgi:hypothetical protein
MQKRPQSEEQGILCHAWPVRLIFLCPDCSVESLENIFFIKVGGVVIIPSWH